MYLLLLVSGRRKLTRLHKDLLTCLNTTWVAGDRVVHGGKDCQIEEIDPFNETLTLTAVGTESGTPIITANFLDVQTGKSFSSAYFI